MTDTVSPITEPHLAQMFTTGAQSVVSPNTEPSPAPIFDTGPHPDPLHTSGWEAAESVSGGWEAAESVSDEAEVSEAESTMESPVVSAPLSVSTSEPASEAASEWVAVPDLTAVPDSELARIARNLDSALDVEPPPPVSVASPRAFSELENVDTDAFLRSVTGHLQPVVMAAQPVVVPGAYQFVKRWKFALIVAGVWLVAAAAGAGFYYWWYTALTKTAPVFGILLYAMACMVASMLVSLVPNRPQIAALAIALMSAPLASMVAAAVLHGAYFFEWIARPTIG